MVQREPDLLIAPVTKVFAGRPDAECLREVIVEGDSSDDDELILLPRNDDVGFYFRD